MSNQNEGILKRVLKVERVIPGHWAFTVSRNRRQAVQKIMVASMYRAPLDSMAVNKRTMRYAKNFDRKEGD